jgi:hypothetical protein
MFAFCVIREIRAAHPHRSIWTPTSSCPLSARASRLARSETLSTRSRPPYARPTHPIDARHPSSHACTFLFWTPLLPCGVCPCLLFVSFVRYVRHTLTAASGLPLRRAPYPRGPRALLALRRCQQDHVRTPHACPTHPNACHHNGSWEAHACTRLLFVVSFVRYVRHTLTAAAPCCYRRILDVYSPASPRTTVP